MPVFEVTVVDTYKVLVNAEHRAHATEFVRDNLLDVAEYERKGYIKQVKETDPTYGYGAQVVDAT